MYKLTNRNIHKGFKISQPYPSHLKLSTSHYNNLQRHKQEGLQSIFTLTAKSYISKNILSYMFYLCNAAVTKIRDTEKHPAECKTQLSMAWPQIIFDHMFHSYIDITCHFLWSYRTNYHSCNLKLFRVLVRPNHSSLSPSPPYLSIWIKHKHSHIQADCPPSINPFPWAILTATLYSQFILQKSMTVFGSGPWVAI